MLYKATFLAIRASSSLLDCAGAEVRSLSACSATTVFNTRQAKITIRVRINVTEEEDLSKVVAAAQDSEYITLWIERHSILFMIR